MLPTLLLSLLLVSLRCAAANNAPSEVTNINADISKRSLRWKNHHGALRNTERHSIHAEAVMFEKQNAERALDEETTEPEDTQEPEDTVEPNETQEPVSDTPQSMPRPTPQLTSRKSTRHWEGSTKNPI